MVGSQILIPLALDKNERSSKSFLRVGSTLKAALNHTRISLFGSHQAHHASNNPTLSSNLASSTHAKAKHSRNRIQTTAAP